MSRFRLQLPRSLARALSVGSVYRGRQLGSQQMSDPVSLLTSVGPELYLSGRLWLGWERLGALLELTLVCLSRALLVKGLVSSRGVVVSMGGGGCFLRCRRPLECFCPWEGKGVETQSWGSVAGQPALAFDSAGCEQAVLGLSPASHPPVCFPQQGQIVS